MAIERPIIRQLNPEVTDPLVLRHLQRLGISKNDVRFARDYSAQRPTVKSYFHKSGKRTSVVTTAPRKNRLGKRISLGWLKTQDGFACKDNLFTLRTIGTEARCVVNGKTKKWNPVLKKERTIIKPDSLTPTLSGRKLVWDHGICTREIILNRGGYVENWVFTENPKGKIVIESNEVGDHEFDPPYIFDAEGDSDMFEDVVFEKGRKTVPKSAFDGIAVYPITVDDSTTVTGAGNGGRYQVSSIYNTAWNYSSAGQSAGQTAGHRRRSSDSKYQLYRASIVFDTSFLIEHTVINDADLSLYTYLYNQDWSGADWLRVYDNMPTYPNVPFVDADYATAKSTDGDYIETFYLSNWAAAVDGGNEYLTHDLGSTLESNIQSNIGNTYTKYYLRSSDEVDKDYDTSIGGNRFIWSLDAGEEPKLVLTYTVPTNEALRRRRE